MIKLVVHMFMSYIVNMLPLLFELHEKIVQIFSFYLGRSNYLELDAYCSYLKWSIKVCESTAQ